jgi:hypothetical protein
VALEVFSALVPLVADRTVVELLVFGRGRHLLRVTAVLGVRSVSGEVEWKSVHCH